MEDFKLFVLGTGTMGRGIAQVAAQSGLKVLFCRGRSISQVDAQSEADLDAVKKNIELIKKGLDRRVSKGKMTSEEVTEIIERIIPVADINECRKADFVIETISEDVKLKQEAFRKLEEITRPDVVLATNTTSCSITEIASAIKNPNRVIGLHFFNPAFIMKLVEIMPGLLTDDNTIKATEKITIKLGKEPVITKREAPAGITSRVLAGLLNEAVWVLHEGIATVDDIDKAIVLGCNHKIGPLALIDLIGVDVHLAKTKMLYAKTGDPRYRSCYLLEQMVTAGYLGKKAGKGFYDYTKEELVPLKIIRN